MLLVLYGMLPIIGVHASLHDFSWFVMAKERWPDLGIGVDQSGTNQPRDNKTPRAFSFPEKLINSLCDLVTSTPHWVAGPHPQ